jgi:intein/homing endonuclease
VIQFHPYKALLQLFGRGTQPSVARAGKKIDLKQAPDPLVSAIYNWYKKQASFGTDRASLYKDFDNMDEDDIIAAALDLYSEDASQVDATSGRSVWVEAKDANIQKLANALLDTLQVEERVCSVARGLAKYGDYFAALHTGLNSEGRPVRIVGFSYCRPHVMVRCEDEIGRLEGFVVTPDLTTYKGPGKEEAISMPWDYVHFRIIGRLGEDGGESYGTSLIRSSRKVYRDLSLMEQALCLGKGTKISLVNGTEVPIEDLVDRDPFWVYSYDHETGKIVPGKATSRKTRENAELVEVELDNGERVRCTPDHRFMLRDGSYKQAQDLQPGESLMPLYRSLDGYGYERLWCPRTRRFGYTHRRFGEQAKRGYVIHHVNCNKRDNCPENLLRMTVEEHLALHHSFPDPNHGEKCKIAFARRTVEQRRCTWLRQSAAQRRIWASLTGEEREARAEKVRFALQDEDVLQKIAEGVSRAHSIKTPVELNQTSFRISETRRQKSVEEREKSRQRMIAGWRRRRECYGPTGRSDSSNVIVMNHKVVAVRILEEREDAYDLTVEKYHNFALTAGVFVHNCVYRLRRAPDRLKWKIDTGSAPPAEANDIINFYRESLRNRLLIDPETGEIRTEVDPLCFTGDTKISLLDGTEVTIKDLAKRNEPFWVYSYDHETRRFVLGKAVSLGVTGRNAKLVEVELDNGEKVRCTPGHKWMLRDGSYKRAQDLQPGESLMPLYRLGKACVKKQREECASQLMVSTLNHVVVAVRPLEECEDVYDIYVEKYHNFALSAGVFVHNSLDEDIFIPTGEGSLTDVEMLSGSPQVGSVLDVEYMRKRLFSCLRIPPDYMGFAEAQGGLLGKSPLSDQDVQFARQEKRLQRAVMVGFAQIIQIDLALRGIDPQLDANEFRVHMCPVSFLDELQRAESAKVRAEIVQVLTPLGETLGVDKQVWTQYVMRVSGFPSELFNLSKQAEERGLPKIQDALEELLASSAMRDYRKKVSSVSSLQCPILLSGANRKVKTLMEAIKETRDDR